MTYADEWSQVYSALADSKWDFRTVKGIAEETGLEQERVDRLLEEHQSEIRWTVSRNRGMLYTLKSRPVKLREYLADLQMFASKSL